MLYATPFLAICLLSGCAGSPPKPPAVTGDYRPINKIEAKASGASIPLVQASKQGGA